MSDAFPWAPKRFPDDNKKYCARCKVGREYIESAMDDGGTELKCVVCGCCVGYRYPIEEHEPFVVDPYKQQNDEPMTVDQYMHMKGF